MIVPDALTEILQTVHLKSTVLCHSKLTAPWGIHINSNEGAMFHIVTSGEGWLSLDNQLTPIFLNSGDLVVLPYCLGHVISDNLESPVVELEGLTFTYEFNDQKTLLHGGGGKLTQLISGYFNFQVYPRNLLLAALPPLIHIKGGEDGQVVPWLEVTLQFITYELGTTRPGRQTVVTRLADVLFIQAIRAYLAGLGGEDSNWLKALTDSAIGPALNLIHCHPEKNWTVASLAAQLAMSRSAFAARFTQLVGQPPLQYLTAWRMQKAAELLRDDGPSLKEIAERVGYDSEIAFSRAFKRWAGMAPGAFRRCLA